MLNRQKKQTPRRILIHIGWPYSWTTDENYSKTKIKCARKLYSWFTGHAGILHVCTRMLICEVYPCSCLSVKAFTTQNSFSFSSKPFCWSVQITHLLTCQNQQHITFTDNFKHFGTNHKFERIMVKVFYNSPLTLMQEDQPKETMWLRVRAKHQLIRKGRKKPKRWSSILPWTTHKVQHVLLVPSPSFGDFWLT